jgi:predicted outer membrane lipoprotein
MTPLDFAFGLMLAVAFCFLIVLFYEYKLKKLQDRLDEEMRHFAQLEFDEARKRQVREDFEKERG